MSSVKGRCVLAAGWLALTSLTSLTFLTAGAPLHFQAVSAQQPSTSVSPSSSASAPRAVLDQYCVTCHNAKLRTAGLALDGLDLADPSAQADVWEKVVRKVRTGAMPPLGRPRPDQTTADGLASWLETALDRAAAAHPNPGKQPGLHRLSRTEYRNAVRDLLALPDLPKEMDVALLLPADNSSSGFDNLADLLFVSPTLLDGYLSAAQKISRLAVGDPAIPVIVDTYRFPPELPQDVHIEGLPQGTRGGTVVHSQFPLDGEYALQIEFAGRATEPHQLEITVDGTRVHLFTIGDQPNDTPVGADDDPEPDPDLQLRFPLKAGPRAIGITFLQHTGARPEALVRSRQRGRGQQPALASVSISGPYDANGPGDTPSRRRIFVCRPASPADEAPCARQILSTLSRRAFRRPVTDADVQLLLPFYNAGRSDGGFDTGIQRAVERLLVSPQFLFRIERDPAGVAPGAGYRVSDLQLASRLSFFLWSSIPDDELLAAAERGTLKDRTVLEQQVRRMLADPRSETLVSNFAAQWLYLRDVDAKRPDEKQFPDFDESLRRGLRRETELFLDSILRENHSALDLLSANYTFVNERLARHYGIPNVYGSHFRRVTLGDDSGRSGLLGQGSILTLTSYATRTSPVLRGKWILENILSSPPPPPPPNVPVLVETNATGEVLTLREAMVRHRANPVCASCHAQMDQLGFALENFDAIGRWRTSTESGAPIDVSATLPDGTKMEGPAGLGKVLRSHPEQFVTTVTEKLLMYALGRNLESFDAPAVRAITRDAGRHDYRIASLILGIVNSTPFQMRKAPASPSLPGVSASRP